MAIPCEYGVFHIPNASIVYDFLNAFSQQYKPVHSYLSTAICVVGAVSNLCNIVVLTRSSMRTPVNVILCSIALFDLVVMISNMIFILHFQLLITCDSTIFSRDWAVFMSFHAQLSVIGHSVSVWLSVTMAFLRYMVIRIGSNNSSMCQSFRVTMFHAFGSIFMVFVLVFVCNLPHYASYSIRTQNANEFFGPCGNHSDVELVHYVSKNAAGRRDNCFLLRLAFWLNGLVLKMVPCILLTFFMTVLLRILAEVKKRRMRLRASASAAGAANSTASTSYSHSQFLSASNAPRSQSNSISFGPGGQNRRCSAMAHHSDPAADRTTRMLIAVICVFLATELPQGLMAIATGLYSMEFHMKIYTPLGDMFDILSLINSCATFVIYCTMSRQYRKEFRRIFFPKEDACWKSCKLERHRSYMRSRASTVLDQAALNEDINLSHVQQQMHKTTIPEIIIDAGTCDLSGDPRSSVSVTPGGESEEHTVLDSLTATL